MQGNKTVKAVSVLLLAFLLSGCATEENIPAASITGKNNTQVTSQSSLGLQVSGSQETQQGGKAVVPDRPPMPDNASTMQLPPGEQGYQGGVTQVGVQYSAEDQTAYDDAIRLRDATKCTLIKDIDLKATCDTDVSDLKILDEALTKLDKTQCQKLSNNDRKTDCVAKVDAALSVQNTSNQTDAQAKLRDEIIQSKDVSRCKELTVYGYQVDCESNILTSLAIEKKDKSICSQATQPDAQFNCETVYDKANS